MIADAVPSGKPHATQLVAVVSSELDSQPSSQCCEVTASEATAGFMIFNLTVYGVELQRSKRVEVPHDRKCQIIADTTQDVLIAEIQV